MPTPSADVVLIHGYTGIAATWDRVVEHLDPALRAHAVTLRGHQGGRPLQGPPVIEEFVDGVADELDALGLRRAHLVGNSLGGWTALELAARGRARSVLALAPAGFWPADDPLAERRRRVFVGDRRDAARFRRLLPLLYRSGRIRRHAMRHYAAHGERMTPEEALGAARGSLACSAHPAVLETTAPGARAFDRFDCPVRIRLCEHDFLFPPDHVEDQVRRRVLGADVTTLRGVGHIPMIDDPALVAREIEASVRAASA